MNQLMSKWIKHSVDYDRYGNNISNKLNKHLSKNFNTITNSIPKKSFITSKGEVNEVLSQVDNLVKQYKVHLKTTYEKSITSISTVQMKWLRKIMKQAGVRYELPTTVLSSIRFSPIANITDYNSLINNICTRIEQSLTTIIKNSFIIGESTDILKDKMLLKFDKLLDSITLDTKLFVNSVFALTNKITFKKNKEKVYYCAVLDSSICLECASLSGKVFEIDEAPYLQRHYRCRCTLIPVSIVKDEPILTFNEWLNTLSDKEQLDVLGRSRYNLYKSGTIKPTQLVDNGETLSLKELVQIQEN